MSITTKTCIKPLSRLMGNPPLRHWVKNDENKPPTKTRHNPISIIDFECKIMVC